MDAPMKTYTPISQPMREPVNHSAPSPRQQVRHEEEPRYVWAAKVNDWEMGLYAVQ